MRISFGKKGIPVQEAIHLVRNEIKGWANINHEVPRAILIKLAKIAEEFKDDPRVLFLDVGTERYSSFPWKSEKVEMIGHVQFEIGVRHGDETKILQGNVQFGGEFFTSKEISAVDEIGRYMNSFSYKIVREFVEEHQKLNSVASKDLQDFVSFVNGKLFTKVLEIAAKFPWHLWFWDAIYQFSSVRRLHRSVVPSHIARLFIAAIGMIQSRNEGSIDIDKSDKEYSRQVNSEEFRTAKTQVGYICQQWYYLNTLSFASDSFSELKLTLGVNPEEFTLYECVVPDFKSKGTSLDFIRAIHLNFQRTGFSGGYPRGFSWFFIRTYVNMLFSHFDPEYSPGPPEHIPLHELARAFLPIQESLLKECGIEVEHLICVIGAYLNFFNDWLKKSVKDNPDFIPLFTLGKESISEIDEILNLTGHMKILKEKLNSGSLPKKYNKADIPKNWEEIVQNIHEKLSIGKDDIQTLDVSRIDKPYLFYKFANGQYVVCCADLLLGLDSVLLHYNKSGEFGRVKGRIFEEFASLFPSDSGWFYGRDMKINELVGRKVGTDLDVVFLEPPFMVVGSCKTEGADKISEIKNEEEAAERWDQLHTYLKDIDDLASWLNSNFERKEVKRKLRDSLQSAGQNLKESKVTQLLKEVEYIIPVVITPGIEFILDISDNTMLTDWIPRICTPKELLLYLGEPLLGNVEGKSFVIRRLGSGASDATVPSARKMPQELRDWSFVELSTRQLAIVWKNKNASEFGAFDFNSGSELVIEIPQGFQDRKLVKGEIYSAKIEAYIAKMPESDEKRLLEIAKTDIKLREEIELAKKTGAYGYILKLRLAGITPYVQQKIRNQEKHPLVYHPSFKKPITEKTVEQWNAQHPNRTTTLQSAPQTSRQCKICKTHFSRTDEELIKFLEPIYPTKEFEQSTKSALIERFVGDPFICSKCFFKHAKK